MFIDADLIQLILDEYHRILVKTINEATEALEEIPFGIYVELMDTYNIDRKLGIPIQAWIISKLSIKESKVKSYNFDINKPYYKIGFGWFSFSENILNVSINWQMGPRYGRGNLHRIGKDSNEKYLIDRGQNTWVS